MPWHLSFSWETGLENSATYPTVLARSGRFPGLGRGLAAGDFDNDGRIDLLMVVENSPLLLLHNQTPQNIIFSRCNSRGPLPTAMGWGHV